MSKTTEVREQIFTAPADASATAVHAAISTAAAITSGITNPDVARVLSIVGAGASHGATGDVVITGTDIQGNAITDTLTLNGNTTVVGARAFKTVTEIDTTGVSGIDSSNTVEVGVAVKLGLDCYCDEHSFTGFAGASSFGYDASEISKNFVTLSASLDGSADQVAVYIPSEFPEYGRVWG